MACVTVFALPATLSTASSLDSTPTNGRRITLRPNLSHTVRVEIGTTFNTGLSKTSRVQFASKSTFAYLAGKLLQVMDVHVVFHVQFEVLLANGIDLHLYGICDTVIVPRPSTPWCDPMCKQRSSFDAKASLQTAAFPYRSRSSRSDIGIPS